jgi:hypothetical protein
MDKYYAALTYDGAVDYYVSVNAPNISVAHDHLTYFIVGTRHACTISSISKRPMPRTTYVDLLSFESPRS